MDLYPMRSPQPKRVRPEKKASNAATCMPYEAAAHQLHWLSQLHTLTISMTSRLIFSNTIHYTKFKMVAWTSPYATLNAIRPFQNCIKCMMVAWTSYYTSLNAGRHFNATQPFTKCMMAAKEILGIFPKPATGRAQVFHRNVAFEQHVFSQKHLCTFKITIWSVSPMMSKITTRLFNQRRNFTHRLLNFL
jgi:hypothetical protein